MFVIVCQSSATKVQYVEVIKNTEHWINKQEKYMQMCIIYKNI